MTALAVGTWLNWCGPASNGKDSVAMKLRNVMCENWPLQPVMQKVNPHPDSGRLSSTMTNVKA